MSLNFSLTQEQIDFYQTTQKSFFALAPYRDEIREKVLEREFPQKIWDCLCSTGAMGFLISKDYGGSEKGLLHLALALEAMTSTGFELGLPVLTNMAALALNNFGQERIQKEFLPQISQGKLKIAVAATEAHSGFNMFNIKTSAKKEGDHYLINGSKIYISSGDVADYFLLFTRTTAADDCKKLGMPKVFGLSLFLLEAKSKGLTQELMTTRGEGSARQFILNFDNVTIPSDYLLGEENQGAMVVLGSINVERVLFSALALGIVDFCLNKALSYAKERKVFRDTPIGQYQAVQHPLADLRIRQDALRLMIYRAANAFDNHEDPMQIGFYANSAKYLAAELAFKAVNVAIILNQIAEHVLGLPRSY